MAEKSIKNHDILTTYTNKLWNICLINTTLKVPNIIILVISTHACLFIHTASYTIIRSILSGTYKNVPPYTLVRAYTDTEFLYICHSIPLFHLHCYLEFWSNYFSLCTKKHLQNYTWVPYANLQNFSLHLDLKIYWSKTNQNQTLYLTYEIQNKLCKPSPKTIVIHMIHALNI